MTSYEYKICILVPSGSYCGHTFLDSGWQLLRMVLFVYSGSEVHRAQNTELTVNQCRKCSSLVVWRHARRDAGSRRGIEWVVRVSHSRSILSADTADTLSSAALTSAKSHLYFRYDQCALHCSRLTYPIRGMLLVMLLACSGLRRLQCVTSSYKDYVNGFIIWGNALVVDPGLSWEGALHVYRGRTTWRCGGMKYLLIGWGGVRGPSSGIAFMYANIIKISS